MYYNDMNEKIIYVNNSPANGFLDVFMAGVTYPSPDYIINQSFRKFYVFEYVVSGKGVIVCGENKYNVGAGDFYLLKYNSDTYYYADKKTPYEKIWINVAGEYIDMLASLYKFPEVTVKRINVRQIFLEIHDILSNMTIEDTNSAIKQLSRKFFELVSEIFHSELFPEKNTGINIGEQIKNFIDNNIYNDIALEDITENFHITKMHVIRLFKNEYGITPMQYLINKRIEISKSLLSNTLMPIKEISVLLKYSNTQHFSNTFKKYTGMSPNQFRQAE